MSIKALFVDLGGVLITNKAREVSDRFERGHGLKLTDIQDTFKFIQTGNRTEEELNSYLANKSLTRELWDSFTKDFFNSEQRNDSLYKILKKAHSMGVLVVYTTNNSSALEAIIDKFSVRDAANIIINSSAAGVAKPDSSFWQLSLEETRKKIPDILPKEILVLDDSEKNCVSARNFGLLAIIYKTGVSDPEIIGYLNK